MRFLLLSLLFNVFALSISAQQILSGTIKDAKTGEPIRFANVYFAQTTFGGTTDADGNYSFTKFPPGKYALTVSYIGYKPFQLGIQIEKGAQQTVDIQLEEDIKVLNEIVVKPGNSYRERDLADFKYYFLGQSRFSDFVTIKNPDDIHVYFDTKTTILYAHSLKPLIIENSLTGYRIYYHIQTFEFHAKTQLLINHGIPRFEEMKPKTIFERKRWEKNRAEAYQGSFLHFARAWNAGTWPENGFSVYQLFRIPNPNRPPDAYLKSKIDSLRGKTPLAMRNVRMGPNGLDLGSDSLSHFLQLQSLPKEIDSVGAKKFRGNEFNDSADSSRKNFTGMLQISTRQKEDRRYAAFVGRPETFSWQNSIVHQLNPVRVYENGYVEDINDILLERYWAWSDKISVMLPLDYVPKKENDKK